MNIIGTDIILRAIEDWDNEMLLNIINDPETEYMLGGWSFPISSKNQDDWSNSLRYDTNTLRCVIETKKDKKSIGVAMLTNIDYKNGTAEIHIKLSNNDCRGKGYGTDAIDSIVKYAFNELRLHLIYSQINSYNTTSKKLFEKCGFQFEGILQNRLFKRGKYIDVLSYSIINGGSCD